MPKGVCHQYTEEQKTFLKDHAFLPRKKLTEQFNSKFGLEHTQTAISTYCKRYGLLTGRTGCFEKGERPWNTGTKGVCKPNSGSFKPGKIPGNKKPIGHERICSKDGFILINVAEQNPYTGAESRYRPKHHVIWEQAYGPVPKGMILRFIDGDKLNCELSNLECLSQSVHLRMNKNRVNELPDELKETGRLISKLEVASFEARSRIN
ncbi:HNH endonuclease signature motif containing protein [Vibrio cholerae]|uniref:HNH endonuclease signature motif containing protein n=1 Tax=Vibrio cholerae TaxID=666 RepID=UPI0028DEC583|nr:HNH endonuclease signature motif containing protein [Vibrio cholerae]EKA4516910.1 HNH endonuclease [Vibrio cholerae]EKF9771733.1 HNH endonuclease [Vibrio cholerae]MDV2323958.1 HNH endonuclease signature motif containing protein [Vibrio cholerae]HDZ9676243.1 HNH endonuclease [Vibrio cholerae]